MRANAAVEWTDDGSGRLPVFYCSRKRLVDPLHDYVASVAEPKVRAASSPAAYASTVDGAAYALLGWLRYLDSRGIGLWQASDSVFRAFRTHALKAVKASTRGKNDERVGKRTVNTKLEWIYRFYTWAQGTGLCEDLIGPEAPVTSSLPLIKEGDSTGSSLASLRRGRYPCCFSDVTGSAGGAQYFATRKDKKAILRIVAALPDPFLRERDHLIIELSDRVGWRAGTLTGLLVDDFSRERFDEAEDGDFSVTPSVQKFGHGFSFDVPATLAARVIRYIDMRAAWLNERDWDERRAGGMLFLSVRDGRPLGPKTIVQRVGQYFRAIGVPARVGAGHHALRRKFSTESTRDDLDSRRELGLSTAVEDVLHANAQRLGQKRIGSQVPYQRAVRDSTREAEANVMRRALHEADAAAVDKDKEIADLKAMVALLEAKSTKRPSSKVARARRSAGRKSG